MISDYAIALLRRMITDVEMVTLLLRHLEAGTDCWNDDWASVFRRRSLLPQDPLLKTGDLPVVMAA